MYLLSNEIFELNSKASHFQTHVRMNLYVHTGSGTHTGPRSNITGVLYREQSGRGVKISTHLHPVPSLGMVGFTSTLERNNFDLFLYHNRENFPFEYFIQLSASINVADFLGASVPSWSWSLHSRGLWITYNDAPQPVAFLCVSDMPHTKTPT